MSAIKSKLALMKTKADNYDNLLSDNQNYQSKINDLENKNQELIKTNSSLQNDIMKIYGDKCILTNKIKFLENSVDNKTVDYYKKIEHIIASYESKINNVAYSRDEYDRLLKSFNELKLKYERNCNRSKNNFELYTSMIN